MFALTQVTQLMSEESTWRGAGQGVILLALLWWIWTGYVWLGNGARIDEGVLRAGLQAAMAGLFVAALAIPGAFGEPHAGWASGVVFAVAYGVARGVHVVAYYLASLGDDVLRRQSLVHAVPAVINVALLVAGSLLGVPWQAGFWLLALVVDYAGVYVIGTVGARIRSARHFAERHGLVVIVALGESILAIGAGIGHEGLTGVVILSAVLGLAVTLCLWWLYFDVVALVAERVLQGRRGDDRARLARDAFSVLHFPMVAGIVFIALGLKKVQSFVGDAESHTLSDPLTGVPLLALFGGTATYLLAQTAFRYRNLGSVNPRRVAVTVLLLVLLPVAWRWLPALASLALLVVLLSGLVLYDTIRYGHRRYEIRHAESAS